jgi:hypothetical protein
VTGGTPHRNYGHTNYVACIGDEYTIAVGTTNRNTGRGIFFEVRERCDWATQRDQKVRIASIRDGTSNTLAASECIIGFPHVYANSSEPSRGPNDNGCPLGPWRTNNNDTRQRGNSWFRGYFPASMSFTTLMTPNSRLPDCGISSNRAVFGARSFHPGVAQVVMADGSGHAVSETIDWATWRWLGNKADRNPVKVP